MLTPDNQDVLNDLYQRRRGFALKVKAAEARGDLVEARSFQKAIREANSVIQQRGGDLNA